MIDTIIDNAIGYLVCAAIGAIIVYIKFQWVKNKSIEQAVKALTHDSLFRNCRELIIKNERTTETDENLEHLFKAYSGLGMNGTGESLYKQCKKIPMKIEKNK